MLGWVGWAVWMIQRFLLRFSSLSFCRLLYICIYKTVIQHTLSRHTRNLECMHSDATYIIRRAFSSKRCGIGFDRNNGGHYQHVFLDHSQWWGHLSWCWSNTFSLCFLNINSPKSWQRPGNIWKSIHFCWSLFFFLYILPFVCLVGDSCPYHLGEFQDWHMEFVNEPQPLGVFFCW